MQRKKTIGILGGMGPLATCDLYTKIIANTHASTDQEHIHVIIDSNTAIPDRTAALLEGGEDPRPEMIRSARMLEREGAAAIVMPCNTAHGFYDDIQSAVQIPVLHMIRLTGEELKKRGITKTGLMATTGTIRTGIYQQSIPDIELILPDLDEQAALMDMTYNGVKAGVKDYDGSKVQATAERMQALGAQVIILGCTELPLAKEMYHLQFDTIDPTLVLAQAAVEFAEQ
ncbi:MAG: amino acid racemase [Solobacterium sp.]|nr:amino acid racemase [Solobacterium sp.]